MIVRRPGSDHLLNFDSHAGASWHCADGLGFRIDGRALVLVGDREVSIEPTGEPIPITLTKSAGK